MRLKNIIGNIKWYHYFKVGRNLITDPEYTRGSQVNELEKKKSPSRTEVLNFLLSGRKGNTSYLEIGVRNPDDNFNLINANQKYSVDPGVEFKSNPVDFKITSDVFFDQLKQKKIAIHEIKFDVIFVDGLHLAEQADRDIKNALEYIKEDGFLVLHDCNPPTEWHARENFYYHQTPANKAWNGTTWKAFVKWRQNSNYQSCCIDTDWGIGVISIAQKIGNRLNETNPFYEYNLFDKNRKEILNLIDFESFKKLVK
jgi:hypothetical protein